MGTHGVGQAALQILVALLQDPQLMLSEEHPDLLMTIAGPNAFAEGVQALDDLVVVPQTQNAIRHELVRCGVQCPAQVPNWEVMQRRLEGMLWREKAELLGVVAGADTGLGELKVRMQHKWKQLKAAPASTPLWLRLVVLNREIKQLVALLLPLRRLLHVARHPAQLPRRLVSRTRRRSRRRCRCRQ